MRGEQKRSARTQVEVVTDGLFLRRLQADPSLEGVSCVLFDEFHERRKDADLALALLREAIPVLRPDLALVLMSATLDLSDLRDRPRRRTVPTPFALAVTRACVAMVVTSVTMAFRG